MAMLAASQCPLAEGSMAKVYSSEAFSRVCSDVLDVSGPASLARGRDGGLPRTRAVG
jgi:hypothetical protein